MDSNLSHSYGSDDHVGENIAVSAIIPCYKAYKDAEYLECTLNALGVIHRVDEIILVVNDQRAIKYREKFLDFKKIRIVEEPVSNSYKARNTGARLASGNHLLFIDADIKATRYSLDSLIDCYMKCKAKTILAPAIRQGDSIQNQTLAEKYDVRFGLPQRKYFKNGWLPTATILLSKSFFISLQGFRIEAPSGADFEFSRRATENGGVLAICDNSIFIHKVRCTFAQLLKKQKRVTLGLIHNRSIHPLLKLARLRFPLVNFINALASRQPALSLLVILFWCSRVYFFLTFYFNRSIK